MLNLVVLIGNLGADPEIRATPSGVKVAKMRLAVNDYWTNRVTGDKEKRTHWIDLNAWDHLAKTAERFLTRGQRIAVRGSLEYREWTAHDGSKRSRLEVRVRELIMLSPKETSRPSGDWDAPSKDTDSYDKDESEFTDNKRVSAITDHKNDDSGISSDYPDHNQSVDDDDIPF